MLFRSGHALGKVYRVARFRPYLVAAARLLDQNSEHPALIAAQEWADRELAAAFFTADKRPWSAWSRLCVKLREAGVTGTDVLVRVIAAVAMLRDDPYAFPDERCWKMNLLAVLARTGREVGGAKRVRLGVAARLYVADRVLTALGGVAHRA